MIKEIVEYYYNQKSQTLQVSFRIDEDTEDYIRQDEFEVDYLDNSGYSVLENFEETDIPITYEEETDDFILDDDFIEEAEYSIDETELKLFLLEYYKSNPKKLPLAVIF
jgi:hypothetical protein